jgi:CRP-like cAMP-binding protein
MLSIVEKVIILKSVSIFSEIPSEILAEIAQVSSEVEAEAGKLIFSQGDLGDSLYVVVDGCVRVHDGNHTLNTLGTSEVFGEMALLDPAPRLASVTAEDDTRLLRIDQESFFELMEDQPQVAQGVIRVLTRRLRDRVKDLDQLRSQSAPVEAE